MFELNSIQNKTDTVEGLIVKAIDYLNKYSTDIPKLFTDSNGCDAHLCLVQIISHYEINFQTFVAKGFEVFLSNLMLYFYEIRNDLNLEKNNNIKKSDLEFNKKRVLILANSLYMKNLIFRRSKQFCIEFVHKQGLKPYISFLKDQKFMQKYRDTQIVDFSNDPYGFLDYVVLNLSSLSLKTADELKQEWNDLDSVNTFLNVVKVKESLLSDAYMAIAYILDDKQIESLTEIHLIADLLSLSLKTCATNFVNNIFKRAKRQVTFKGKPIDCQVQVYTSADNVDTSIIVLMESLYRLSVNDRLKNDIYFKNEMKNCFESFLIKGRIFKND